MTAAERAQELLESHLVWDWVERRASAVAGLPRDLRPIAFGVVGRDVKGKSLGGHDNRQEARKVQAEAAEQFDGLVPADRTAIFEALFPKLGPYVERAWQMMIRMPYQTGYDRKAFRAPNSPGVSRNARVEWLSDLFTLAGPYDEEVAWFAAWVPYLGRQADSLGNLLAAAVDVGDEAGQSVFGTLTASANGEHGAGAMGTSAAGAVARALLGASRPEGWGVIEQMLLAAQPDEGLRQTILECVHMAHPEAFRRMLCVIVHHDLTRSGAVVRHIDGWFGLALDSANTQAVNDILTRVLDLLDSPEGNAGLLSGQDGSAEDAYLALWALAFNDACAAIRPASMLLDHPDPERRFVGAHLLAQLKVSEAYHALFTALDDPDLRVVIRAFVALSERRGSPGGTDLFERLEALIPRFPAKKRELEPLVWPWLTLSADRRQVASALVWSLGERSPKRLIPYLTSMESWDRRQVVELLAERERDDREARDTILALVGDSSSYVREMALEAAETSEVSPEEAQGLESLLSRKAGDMRHGVLSALMWQTDEAALASAQRLMGSADRLRRLAGLELLHNLFKAGRSPVRCREQAAAYRRSRPSPGTDEEKLLDAVTGRAQVTARLM